MMGRGKNEPQGCLSVLLGMLGLGGSSRSKPGNDPFIYYTEGDDEDADLASDADLFPYKRQQFFLSRTENSFFHVLSLTVKDSAAICPKVNLRDIFYVPNSRDYYPRTYWNKIDRKHVDFLLCDPGTMQPIVALELDDSSHQRSDRIRRDEFVDSVFKAAGLPLVHVSAHRSYNTRELAAELQPYLPALAEPVGTAPVKPVVAKPAATAPVAAAPVRSVEVKPAAATLIVTYPSKPAVAQAEQPVLCPSCGIPMKVRSRQEEGADRLYQVCPNYKVCHQFWPLDGARSAAAHAKK